jgi:hypothetical protein
MTSEWTEEYSLETTVHPLDLLTYQVDNHTGCWNWIGKTWGHLSCWYGRIEIGGGEGFVYAHRLSYQLYVGDIPRGMNVCHKCDNGLCVNPSHLFLGTQQDNILDAIRKGRFTQHLRRDRKNKIMPVKSGGATTTC